MLCCGVTWVKIERAHCRRTGGSGHVFDDAALWDQHRRHRHCLDSRTLDLIHTSDGTWLRALQLTDH